MPLGNLEAVNKTNISCGTLTTCSTILRAVDGMKMEVEKAISGAPMKDGRRQVMAKVSERDVEPE